MIEHSHTAHVGPPQFLPASARNSWGRLDTPLKLSTDPFDPDRIEHLPAPVRRWLRHAIAPGTPLRFGVRVAMHGTIRIGRWMPFTATQIITPGGYIWAATAGRFPLQVTGFDRYSDNTGEMQWRLLRRIPVVTTSGLDVTRSAAGRLASEMVGLLPSGALAPGVTWHGIDEDRAIATVVTGAFTHQVTIDVDDRGSLRQAFLPRWGSPDKGPFQEHLFGVECERETTFDGYTLPASIGAGWWFGSDRWSDGEFFRCEIDRAEFF